MKLDLRRAIAPTNGRRRYVDALRALEGKSGIYAIIDASSRELVYIGESHTGRLYDTITRHFRAWKPQDDPQGRRVGGTTYDRSAVLVAWATGPADQALDAQHREIQRLGPRDNTNDGATTTGELAARNAGEYEIELAPPIGHICALTIEQPGGIRTELEWTGRAPLRPGSEGEYLVAPAPKGSRAGELGSAVNVKYRRRVGGLHYHDFTGRQPVFVSRGFIVIGPGADVRKTWIEG